MIDVGIVGVGTYLPEKTMKAAEIARLTNGVWSEDAVINKLGIKQRYLPGPDDGTQEMGAKAALKCLENTGVDPKEIDVILCIGEEWKEYPLTTSACYIQDRIGATNAWGIDVQNRCCTCVSDRLGEVECPTLIVNATDDVLIPLVEQTRLHEGIKNSEMVIIPKCGHASMYEKPMLFSSLVLGWINVKDEDYESIFA